MASAYSLLDMEDLSASNFRKLFSNGLVRELHVGKHQVGDLAQVLHAIDGTNIIDSNAPGLYSSSSARINTRSVSVEEKVMEFNYGCGPWVSPLPSLTRPKQFPVMQLVFVQCSAAEFK